MTPDLIVRCTCSNLLHPIAILRSDCDRSVLVSLDYERSFWSRLKVAWRYLWSDVCQYVDAAEVVIRDEDLPRLKEWCNPTAKSIPTRQAQYQVLATDVYIWDDTINVDLDDGRTISVPLECFPRLQKADPDCWDKWEFIGGGVGIRWEQCDEDISVEGLLQGRRGK